MDYLKRKGLQLFPTCVGMNRWSGCTCFSSSAVPHVRGDEPINSVSLQVEYRLFPTCVGMNRQ